MNVDIDNFREAVQKISELRLIDRCSTVSYDLEFTGVKLDNNQRQRSQHFPFERYKKMRNVVNKFNIIQLGLTFNIHENDGRILAYPFNFYLFPRENALREPVISMQGNTVEFNSSQGMDWNRWIRKGIPFVRISDVKELETIKQNSKTFQELIENADVDIVETINQIIQEGNKLSSVRSQVKVQIPKANSFYVRKVIEKFSETKSFTIRFSGDTGNISADKTVVVLDYISPVEREKLKEKQNQAIFGITLIFEELWKKGKTFVGHNCMFDLLYIYDALVDSLPESYIAFKDELNSNGKKFYDTKILANLFENRNDLFPNGTTLELLYAHFVKNEKQLIEDAKITLGKGFQSYDLDKPALHQAGFDSYLTGWVFYQLMKKFPQFDQFEGKINLFKCYFQMNIHKSDAIVPDLVVFVAIVFPPSRFVQREQIWKAKLQLNKQIKECFKEDGIYQYVICHDGFKEIYIEIKDRTKLKEITGKIVRMTEKRRLPQIYTLPRFIEIKGKQMITDKVTV